MKFRILFIAVLLFKLTFAQTDPKIIIKDGLGNESVSYDCGNPVTGPISLTATAPNLYDTSGYSVSKNTLYSPYSFTSGTKQDNPDTDNNKYFKKVSIGFDFCFFNNTYSELVLGNNGLITFDQTLLGQTIFNFSQNNPNTLLPNNAIFGAMQEGLTFDNTSKSGVYTELVGTAPYRKFVITYYNGKINYNGTFTDCDNLRLTTQIVLSESTNKVDIFLDSKPLPCSDSSFRNSLLGVINDSGNSGFSPSGRNTGVWQASKESYTFSPIGNIIKPAISWYNGAGTQIGNTDTINYTVTKSENITAKATYNICGKSVELSDIFPISVYINYPLAADLKKYYCSLGTTIDLISINPQITNQDYTKFDFSYYKTLAEAQSGVGISYTSTVLDNAQIFYVRIVDKLNPTCFTTAKLTLNIASSGLIKNDVTICDSQKGNYLLSDLQKLGILEPTYTGTVQYFLLPTATTPITTIDLTDGMQIWLQLEYCPNKIGPLTVHLDAGPKTNTPINISITTCDNDNDSFENYDFSTLNNQVIANPNNYIIKYYNRLEDAKIGNTNYQKYIYSGINKLYIRVEYKSGGSCFSITEMNLDVTFTKVNVRDNTYLWCFDGNEDVTIDLTNPKIGESMWIGTLPSPSVLPVYYLTKDDAINNVNPITNFTITKDGYYVYDNVYARFEQNGCYAIKKLTLTLVKPAVLNKTKAICDNLGDNSEIVYMHWNQSYFVGGGVKVKYFDVNTGAPITFLNVTPTNNKVKVEITSNYNSINGNTCTTVDYIFFELTSAPNVKPTVTVNVNNLCDNNSNGYELFDANTQNENIISGSNAYTFDYYDSYNAATGTFSNRISDPKNIKIYNSTPKTIYVRVTSSAGCFSKSEIVVTYTFTDKNIKTHTGKLEHCSLNNVITYNLNDALPQMFIQTENSTPFSDLQVAFYRNYDPVTETVSNQLPTPNNIFTTGRSSVNVYAKFTSSNGCYTITPIQLITYLSPLPKNPTIYFCKDKGVQLPNYEKGDLLVSGNYDPSATYNYTFYMSDPLLDPTAQPIDKTKTIFPSNNQKLWFKIEILSNNSFNCNTSGFLVFHQSSGITITNPGPIATKTCDIGNDGIETISLREKEASYKAQYPDAIFTYYSSYPSTPVPNPDSYNTNIKAQDYVFVGIETTLGCPGVDKLFIKLKPTPVFTVNSPVYFCPVGDKITISPNYSGNTALGLTISTYEWTLPNGTKASTPTLPNVNTAGTYHLKITANNGCTFEKDIQVTALANPNITIHPAKLENCFGSNKATYNLNDAISQMFIQAENTTLLSDFRITYYKDYDAATGTLSNLLPAPNNVYTKTVQTNETVYAKFLTIAGCFAVVPIQLISYNAPVASNPILKPCSNTGIYLTDYENGSLLTTVSYNSSLIYNYTFYSSDPTSNPSAVVIDKSQIYYPANNSKVWYKVQLIINNQPACFVIGNITFNLIPAITVTNSGPIGTTYCDTGNDGIETISLREKEAAYKTQYPDAKFTYYTTFPTAVIGNPDAYTTNTKVQNYVFVKIETSAGCPAVDKLIIKLKSTPTFVINSPINFCPSENVIISPNYSPNIPLGLTITDYEWTLPDGSKVKDIKSLDKASLPGIYHLKITADNGCSFEKDIELISYPVPKIYKIVVDGTTVKVLATREGNITSTIYYKMDNSAWQTSYIFNNVKAGTHQFYVKYEGIDCPSLPLETAIFAPATNVITPNGDGVNDKFVINNWNITTSGNSTLQIFDRYNKLLYQQTSNESLEWDGYYLGKPVSTGTYWYVAQIADGKELQGWIFVKNRE